MKKIFILFLMVLLASCSQNKKKEQKISIVVNSDSLLIENLIKQQKFVLAKRKIDSILPLKSLNESGYYYYQMGFNCLMLEEHENAVSNFQKAISLGYEINASRTMIKTANQMKETHDKYN